MKDQTHSVLTYTELPSNGMHTIQMLTEHTQLH